MLLMGSCGHVATLLLGSGNFQSKIFLAKGAAEAFEKTLFQSCEPIGWKLSAYVIMRNHFHLAVETPEPNLSLGMKWLKGTWVMRNNRFRRRTGRPFQGRFKGILLEPEALAAVTSYIHLNPQRAGIESVEQIGEYLWSSLAWYLQKKRPGFLNMDAVLSAIGGIKDSKYAHKKYLDYLRFLVENEPEKKALAFDKLSKGWCYGSKDFKKEALLRIKEKGTDLDRAGLLGMDSGDTQEARELRWELLLNKLAQEAGIELTKLPDKKSAADKVILASLMKARSSVSNSWLTAHLGMGRPASVSQYVGRLELIKGDGWKKKERILSIMKI
jgi:putative transposase